jgi:hypothetical protein
MYISNDLVAAITSLTFVLTATLYIMRRRVRLGRRKATF